MIINYHFQEKLGLLMVDSSKISLLIRDRKNKAKMIRDNNKPSNLKAINCQVQPDTELISATKSHELALLNIRSLSGKSFWIITTIIILDYYNIKKVTKLQLRINQK
ncbi:hypothetical protein XENOCAPTIV_025126 [Xenoophorus captivus]|uniref:Uncharacterized protein n=1 Tax=Xenoophorus captivus TaxID=1517983 RepID=A0ABV0S1I8_9TELE